MNAPLPPGPPPRFAHRASVDDIESFAERIDVRSPGEYAEDHIPGATNLPVLDDAERAMVGTMYVQTSAFDARKAGAAIVARNIARIVETHVHDKPREWTPLVYCWRGGQRSRALVHVLNEIGFGAVQLEGGYRAWRRHVVALLAQWPRQFRYRVVCGPTGSGKSRLISAIAAEGAQVLDLETLARHRGSLLGDIPGAPQPSQKAFESALYDAFCKLDASLPIFVEAESRRIGGLQVPDALLDTMRASPCIRLDVPKSSRVAMLEADYEHFARDPEQLSALLEPLAKLHGKEAIARWQTMAQRGERPALVDELLALHYDPSYARAAERNFPRLRDADAVRVDGVDDDAFRAAARQLLSEKP
ncbi:MAG TPA: tRNA 2-selenouridine(34) synthase MnmH [Casimicrobiaceae bacterium]|nr:tRNA 2-selenouridine(34) synthase MnmH [Casimicrobiaceae bacterium]